MSKKAIIITVIVAVVVITASVLVWKNWDKITGKSTASNANAGDMAGEPSTSMLANAAATA